MKRSTKTALLGILLCLAQKISAQQTFIPTDLTLSNVKTMYGAAGDGITDDTQALRQACRTYLSSFSQNIVFYLPPGIYRVTDSIRFLNNFFDKEVVLIGQDPATTIIRLDDNAPLFQDAAQPRPMFWTRAGGQAFGMYFKNLTINTGNGNPGAVALDYITSNYGMIENVTITSPDGSGYCGISMERGWPGPGLLKDVTINGFQYGMRITQCEYSMTFEDIALNNQSVAGMYVNCNTLAMRKVVSNNSVPFLIGQGVRLTLLESQLNGGAAGLAAIDAGAGGCVFARDVTTTGYDNVLRFDGTNLPGTSITEYHTGTAYSLFPNNGLSLGLPIEETPSYVNNNPAEWANISNYGAQLWDYCCPPYHDSGPGIQAALNSGAKVIYLNKALSEGSVFHIFADITIPPTVEMIIGFHQSGFGFHNGSKFVISANAATPLFFDGVEGVVVENNSQRTVVMKSASGDYRNTAANTNGKVFLEDFVNAFAPAHPVRMWARQMNPELQSESAINILNDGGQFWILGLKTEGRATLVDGRNNSATEVLGSLIYPASSFSGTNQVAFTIDNSEFSITGMTRTSYLGNGWYGITVVETQGTTPLSLTTPNIPEFYTMPFYRSGMEPLPITLTQFTGQATPAGNALQWRTAREENSSHFELERSPDAVAFTRFQTLPAAIHSTTPRHYNGLDPSPFLEGTFYRLRSVDRDGRSALSDPIFIPAGPGASLGVWPNPAQGMLTLQLGSGPLAPCRAQLCNALGQVVLSQTWQAEDGSRPLTLQLGGLPAGMYHLQVFHNGMSIGQGKVIKD